MTLQPSSEDDPSNQPEANFKNWGRIHVSNWRVWLMKHSIPSTPSWRKCLLKTAPAFFGLEPRWLPIWTRRFQCTRLPWVLCSPWGRSADVLWLILQWPWQIWWPHLMPHRRPFHEDWKQNWTRRRTSSALLLACAWVWREGGEGGGGSGVGHGPHEGGNRALGYACDNAQFVQLPVRHKKRTPRKRFD